MRDFATMENTERRKWELRLRELNEQFLAEVERGAGWDDLRDIVEEMKSIAKGLDHIPASVISFDSYPQKIIR
jgi:hypothetical protein